MLDEVKNELRAAYDIAGGPATAILDTFIQQFDESNVDSNVMNFNEFLAKLSTKTLGNLGITNFSASNEYGSYSFSRDDYEANGRGKTFLDYIPDLGMIRYLIPVFKSMLLSPITQQYIIVHFPNVRVTNEYDKFIDIQDLYARVKVTRDGKLANRFEMVRTTFPFSHYKSGYSHSHLPVLSANSLGSWKNPCTGTGPIVDTQSTLTREYSLPIWGLFVYELSKYVTIESIAGTPYIRLETVGKGDIADGMNNLMYKTYMPKRSIRPIIDEFAQYCARHNYFKFKYADGCYQLGENPIDAIIRLSNAFIHWYNEETNALATKFPYPVLKSNEVLKEYIVANNNIYEISSEDGRDLSAARTLNNKSLFKFKDSTVYLNILLDSTMTPDNKSLLLNKVYCEYIFGKILTIINYRYGKRKIQGENSSQTQSFTSSTNESGEKPYFV